MTETIDQSKGFLDDDPGDIIELTDLIEERLDDGSNADGVLELVEQDDAVETGNTIVPTDEAIEAALSRIIEKKYAKRLDALFVETVERVVEREIAAIKQSLLKDLS
ncbi:MAG: hypothetical protein JEZ12_06535 [Desulfobacterium sp.]|nr:hypothetical protein [Desulfobacterium sp.]